MIGLALEAGVADDLPVTAGGRDQSVATALARLG
jgi:hypothetical protein